MKQKLKRCRIRLLNIYENWMYLWISNNCHGGLEIWSVSIHVSSVANASSNEHGLAEEDSPARLPVESIWVALEDNVGELGPGGSLGLSSANIGWIANDWLENSNGLLALLILVNCEGNDFIFIADDDPISHVRTTINTLTEFKFHLWLWTGHHSLTTCIRVCCDNEGAGAGECLTRRDEAQKNK